MPEERLCKSSKTRAAIGYARNLQEKFEFSCKSFSYRRCERARDGVGQPLDALLLIVEDENVLVHDEFVVAAEKRSCYLLVATLR